MSAQTPIRDSTQKRLEIEDIQDNIVLLKDGTCCLVLKTTAINFGLLSEKEQEATIYAYAGFLNSLTFSIQLIIHSRQKDISSYLKLINQQLAKQKGQPAESRAKIETQIKNYRQFIKNTVKKNKVLTKEFYTVIPFASPQLKKISRERILEKAKVDLYPKKDHLLEQFQRLGLKAETLNNQQLIKLFYNLYNPESQGQRFAPLEEYSAPLIQPKIKKQTQKAPTQKEPETTSLPAAPHPEKKVIHSKRARPLNPLMPKPKEDEELRGQALQKEINTIVQKANPSPDQTKSTEEQK